MLLSAGALFRRFSFAAGMFFAFRMNELIEVAFLPVGCLLLIYELEIALVELLEEVIPGDFFELVILPVDGIRKLKAQDTGLLSFFGARNFSRDRSSRLGPLADFIMILGCSGKCHVEPLTYGYL